MRHTEPLGLRIWFFVAIGGLIVFLGLGIRSTFGIFLAPMSLDLGWGPWLAAVFCVSAMVIFTGGLHEDGLGDFDDDLGGGNPARRLAIMHDSRAGNFAILSLVL